MYFFTVLMTFIFLANTHGLPSTLSYFKRDVDPSDSLTYCSAIPDQVACTKTVDPLSEILFWFPKFQPDGSPFLGAHFECYAETYVGDRYLAGHPTSGTNPCWITASDLGPLTTCPSPVPAGYLCGCDKKQLATCCACKPNLPGVVAVGSFDGLEC